MRSCPVGIPPTLRLCSLLLLVAWVVASCTENLGGLFGDPGNGGGDPGGGGGGGSSSLPASVPVDGALLLDGAPQVVGAWPVSQMVDVDVQAPVTLWFSESVNLSTVEDGLFLRPRGSSGSIGYATTGVAGDRGVILVPDSVLVPSTEYELVATDDLSDLSGSRLQISGAGVLTRFTTAAFTSGVAPQVLATLPPDGQEGVGNDHPLVIVFSKPIDFTGVSAAVSITADGGAASFAQPGSSASDRIVGFVHDDDDADLDAAMQVFIDDTITDTEFSPNSLLATWTASWTSLKFSRPTGLDIGSEPAANLANLSAFPTNVDLGSSALAGDGIYLEIWGFFSSTPIAAEGTLANNGPAQQAFVNDLTNGSGTQLLADGSLALVSWVERGSARSTVLLNNSFVQDTFPPFLVNFGPPADSIASRFRTDLPEARPYGFASEPVSRVEITALGGSAVGRDLVASPSGFFLGPSFNFNENLTEDFDVLLYDVAENPMPATVQGTALFRGFVSSTPAASSLTVEAFDARTLEPLPSAMVYAEDAAKAASAPGSRGEQSGVTGTDGRVSLAAPDPSGNGLATVTVIAPGYHSISVLGVNSSFVSLPLREISPPTVTVSASIANLAGGTIRLGSPILRETNGEPSYDAILDRSFSSMSGILVTPDRPGWWVGFHDVQPFQSSTYYSLFSAEPRLLLDATPGSGSPQVFPAMAFVQSSNASASTTDFIYEVTTLTTGNGFDLPLSASTLSTVSLLPGVAGVATTGVGEIQGISGAAELEVLLQVAAEGIGATVDETFLQLWAADFDGDQAMTRSLQVAESGGAILNELALPGVSIPTGPTSTVTFPSFSLTFTDTLDNPGDWYHLRLADNASPPAEWDFWMPSPDSNSDDDSVILPGLAPAETLGSDAPPLQVSAGSTWSFQVETLQMPGSFAAEGTFFAQLFRDCLAWSHSVFGTSFPVQ